MYILLSQHGKLRYLNFEGAVYRLHRGGISVNSKVRDESKRVDAKLRKYYRQIAYQIAIDKYLNHKYSDLTNEMLKYNYLQIFLIQFSKKNFFKAAEALKHLSIQDMGSLKNKIKYSFALIFFR